MATFRPAVVTAALLVSGAAMADVAETQGGLKIRSDDGRFELGIGGRLHFDAQLIETNDGSGFGSDRNAGFTNKSGAYFRRVYLTFRGKAFGWNYKIEPDFCGAGGVSNNDPAARAGDIANTCREISFQDLYLSTTLGAGALVLGQRKVLRALDELTSSNDLPLIEKNFASTNGIFAGREFANGVFYLVDRPRFTAGAGFYSLHSTSSDATEGTGESARVTFVPWTAPQGTLHAGASFSAEQPHNGNAVVDAVRYFGRLGVSQPLASTTGHTQSWAGELAGASGPFFAQAEYVDQRLDASAGVASQSIDAWAVTATFFVTGESRPYKTREAVFTIPVPRHGYGAVELAARYEAARNRDVFTACSATATRCAVSAITVGATYYVNPNVRFMLNYILGQQDRGADGRDDPRTIAARAQFVF